MSPRPDPEHALDHPPECALSPEPESPAGAWKAASPAGDVTTIVCCKGFAKPCWPTPGCRHNHETRQQPLCFDDSTDTFSGLAHALGVL